MSYERAKRGLKSLSSCIASIAVNGGLLYEAYIIKKGNDTDTN